MKWLNRNDSTDDVEVESGSGGVGRHAGKLGIGGIILVVIVSLIIGKNPLQMLGFVDNITSTTQGQSATSGGSLGTVTNMDTNNDSTLTVGVFNSANDVWRQIFADQFHKTYTNPKLHLYSGSTQTGCGGGSAATGPFYCPADGKVYIDLSFFNELSQRFKAPGILAKAYVVAHEMGHHIQDLLGVTAKLDAARARLSQEDYNKLSVKLELQADFYAGLWAHYAEQEKTIAIEPGDIESALAAANAVGDDNLQKQAQGYVVPESFTHGTSAERMYWFKKGYTTGDFSQGDTFNDPSLN